jgi:Flp pilus assembly protein TadG
VTRQHERGQAAVEVALVLPLLVSLALVLVQVGLVVRDQVLLVHAAREAAREAAVSPTTTDIGRAARGATALRETRLTVRVGDRGPPGGTVTVEVRYRSPTDVPLVGALIGDVRLTSRATMRVER